MSALKVLETSQINLLGMSLELQIRKSPGRHFRMSPGRQVETCLGWSNRIFRGLPGDLEWDIFGTSWGPIFTAATGRFASGSVSLVAWLVNAHFLCHVKVKGTSQLMVHLVFSRNCLNILMAQQFHHFFLHIITL